MRSVRNPQLDLRLDTAIPDAAARWHEGASIRWLGQSLRLTLSREHAQTWRQGDALYLPLPPRATPRQIQDSAEAWLRKDATRYLAQCITEKSALVMRQQPGQPTRQPPRLALSFAARGDWVELLNVPTESVTTGFFTLLRCHWRLIEQPPEVIDAALDQALRRYFSRDQSSHSLFSLHA